MDSPQNQEIRFLRHTVATLAYRAAKVVHDAPFNFAHFRAASTTRTAGQILAHMGDLMDWALRAANGPPDWVEVPPGNWHNDVARFFASLKAFDDRLATGAPLVAPTEKLFQGPIADALTHVGQLATLRRLAGSGIRGESYFRAEIVVGRVGADQARAVREFD